MKKALIGSLLSIVFLFLFASSTHASEGVVELRNNVGGPSRCFATSVLLPDFNYNVLITCRDLIYPVSSEVLKYVVWASPSDGGDPIRFGELNFGKVFFKTSTPFSSIYVTQERNSDVRKPTGAIAMSGNVKQISFLEDGRNIQNEPTSSSAPTTPVPAATNQGNSGGILSVFKTGAVVTVVSIFLIILMLILVKPFK